MSGNIQQLAAKIHMPFDEFIGEMRKRGCSGPTAAKICEPKFGDFDESTDKAVNFN